MVVPVEGDETLRAGTASVVVSQSVFSGSGVLYGRTYDVSADGQRFLVIRDESPTDETGTLIVVRNWFEELRRLESD